MFINKTRCFYNLGKKINFFSSNGRRYDLIVNPTKYVVNARHKHKLSVVPKCKKSFLLKSLKVFFVSTSTVGIVVYIAWQREIFCKDISIHENKECNHETGDIYETAITECRDLLKRIKDEAGIPGIVIGVSVDGDTVWKEGIGYADVENRVPCSENTVMRIASISKSITMAAVAKLWEGGKLDLDKPVQHYVPHFPQKIFDGEPVDITCRHLVSHLGGIRHYNKGALKSNSVNDCKNEKTTNDTKSKNESSRGRKEVENVTKTKEFEMKEYFIKDKYDDVNSSLNLFKDDPLISKPGSKFYYSTHGWTLVSAIVESASQELFTLHMRKTFKKLGMFHTYLDVNDSLIYHRSRNYLKDKRGHLINAPYVDNSYKWAGGGFLSTVGDLLKFANVMLYSLQYKPERSFTAKGKTRNDFNVEKNTKHVGEASKTNGLIPTLPGKQDKASSKTNSLSASKSEDQVISLQNKAHSGFLDSKTVEQMWSPVAGIKDNDWMYGMGWAVLPEKKECEYCEIQRFSISHSGGAIGASSILCVLPRKCNAESAIKCEWPSPPKGITVVILTNLEDIHLTNTAYKIAQIFDNHSCEKK